MEYAGQRYPIELKIRYDAATEAEGLTQLAGYMEQLGCEEGWLVLFDRRADIAWEEKLFCRAADVEGKTIHVLGC